MATKILNGLTALWNMKLEMWIRRLALKLSITSCLKMNLLESVTSGLVSSAHLINKNMNMNCSLESKAEEEFVL